MTSGGEYTPSRRSRLPRILEVNEAPRSDPETPDKSNQGCPTLILTAPTPGLSPVNEESEQSVNPSVSNLNLPPPSSSRPSTRVRPSDTMSQAPSTAKDPFAQLRALKFPEIVYPVTVVHLDCYQGHRDIRKLFNSKCPCACMVCKANISTAMYGKCIFCNLWLCPSCTKRLEKIKGRSLRELIDKVAKGKENHRSAGSGNIENDEAKDEAEASGVLAATDVNTKETEVKK